VNDSKGFPENKPEKKRLLYRNRYFVIGKWFALLSILIISAQIINWTDVFSSLSQISLLVWCKILFLTLLSKIVYAWRWQIICTNGLNLTNVSRWFFLRTNLLSELVGIVVPSVLGSDGTRILKLSIRTGRTAKAVAATVTDRLAGLLSLSILVIVLFPKLGHSVFQNITKAELPTGLLWVGFVIACIVIGTFVWWLMHGGHRSSWVSRMTQIVTRPSVLISSIIMSILGHICLASGQYLPFGELSSLQLTPGIAAVLTSQLARSLPISMLGIGLGELSLVAIVGFLGVAPAVAISGVIIGLVIRYLFALTGMITEFWCDGITFFKSFKQTQSQAEITE